MEVKKSNCINTYYLLTAGFLYGGKICCKINMKKDKHEESTVPYGTSPLLTFLADIHTVYMSNNFRLGWLTGILEHAMCADGHIPKTK